MGAAGNDGRSGVGPPWPTLIVVSGLPATGKTTLAGALADALGWPVFDKDHLKELLVESRVDRDADIDREAARDLGKQSMYLLYAIAGELTKRGTSCIVEAYFHPELAAPELAPLARQARLIQVHCTADDATIVARYRARFEAGERHAVHFDARMVGDLEQRITTDHRHAIPLDGTELIDVRTDGGFDPSIEAIVRRCRG